jgi:hypothetical protein
LDSIKEGKLGTDPSLLPEEDQGPFLEYNTPSSSSSGVTFQPVPGEQEVEEAEEAGLHHYLQVLWVQLW